MISTWTEVIDFIFQINPNHMCNTQDWNYEKITKQ